MKHYCSIIVLSFIILLSIDGQSCSENKKVEQVRDEILALLQNDSDKIIEAMYKTDRLKEGAAMKLYLELLDYYIGEGPGEILSEKITLLGEEILPALIEKKKMRLLCLEEFKDLCYEDIEDRNRKIEHEINAIKKGIVLYAVYPDNLLEKVKRNMEIIIVFLEDYKMSQGVFPEDLSALREYAWKEYGYKLVIYNPWGRSLKYNMLDKNKIIIEAGSDGMENISVSITYP
jgi:hypothetical protein